MSEQTQRAIELFVDRRMKSLDLLTFSWFGGEPLVAKDVVLRLSRYAQHRCAENGVRFQSGMTTNAYALSQALASELIELGQDFFQITLDGWMESHDELRKRADGKGTFGVIWQNLLGLKGLSHKFEVCVRIHVRRDNLANLKTLLREFAKNFQGDPRFYLDFQHLRDMGGDGGKTVMNAFSIAEVREVELGLRAVYEGELRKVHLEIGKANNADLLKTVIVERHANSGESSGSVRASATVASEPYLCYAGKPNSLLIRSNGRIGKCTVALDDPRNDLGQINADGTISVDNPRLSAWFSGITDFNLSLAGCPIKGVPSLPIKQIEIKFLRPELKLQTSTNVASSGKVN